MRIKSIDDRERRQNHPPQLRTPSDQHPECEFDADCLDISDSVRENYNLEKWECSRPVWEEASEKRCVWHACDGQTQEKPHAELEKTVDNGDLHGSAAAGVNLNGIDFQAGVDFIDADLSEADLRRADFSEAVLGDADFSGADLTGANLSDTDLRSATLSGANLTGSSFSDAIVEDAQLLDARFEYTIPHDEAVSPMDIVPESDLAGADLSEANLRRADLSEADLQGADLSEADLKEAELSGADLFHAELSGGRLFRAHLSEANLFRAHLSEANLGGADLSEADLRRADLSGAVLIVTQFSDITANQATTVGKTRSDFSTADEYDELAQGYHNLKTALSEGGLSQRARQARTVERRARTIEARKRFGKELKRKMKRQIKSVRPFPLKRHLINMLDDGWGELGLSIGQELRDSQIRTQFTTWIGGVLSRLLTGYGTRPTFVLVWTGLILLLTTAWFELGPVPSGLEGGPLYYSVVTFVTSPPHPIQEVGEVGMITEIIVLLETYIGTALIVLLGYVLGNRERV